MFTASVRSENTRALADGERGEQRHGVARMRQQQDARSGDRVHLKETATADRLTRRA